MNVTSTEVSQNPGGQNAFQDFRDFIERECGIFIGDEKVYLIESRLKPIAQELGVKDLHALSREVLTDKTGKAKEKVIDAITTNETLWFRDLPMWDILEELVISKYFEELAEGKRNQVRIWSAACSTGQEPYSIAMLIDRLGRKKPGWAKHIEQFEIVATDISPSALFLAISGRYNKIAMGRGLPPEYSRYFETRGNLSMVDSKIKAQVKFKKFNLLNNFFELGKFDIVMCRYVAIYFSQEVKKTLLGKIHKTMNPNSYFFMGATESILGLSDDLVTKYHDGKIYYTQK